MDLSDGGFSASGGLGGLFGQTPDSGLGGQPFMGEAAQGLPDLGGNQDFSFTPGPGSNVAGSFGNLAAPVALPPQQQLDLLQRMAKIGPDPNQTQAPDMSQPTGYQNVSRLGGDQGVQPGSRFQPLPPLQGLGSSVMQRLI